MQVTVDQVNPQSIANWVKAKRDKDKSGEIVDQVDSLRKLAISAFLSGVPGQFSRLGETDSDHMVSIKYPALLRFGLASWLSKDGRLLNDLTAGTLSDVEFCRAMHGIAVTAHYVLAGYPHTPNPDLIHRLMQLVARYGHAQLGIPTRIDLRAHLLQAARGEPALHALKHSYRDHFFHLLEVCFLGHLLLETKLGDGRFLWHHVADHLRLWGDKQKVLRLWYMAALLHDVGYSMDVLKSSCEHLDFFQHSKALQNLVKQFDQAIGNLASAPEMADFCALRGGTADCTNGIERDHGIIGAMHVRALLKKISTADPSVKPQEYEPAVRAIALHNLRRHSDKIVFAQNPLAFLLAICDQLQEWRRPRLPYAISPIVLLARMQGGQHDANRIDGADQRDGYQSRCQTGRL